MDTIKAILASKSFWAGLGLAGLALYQATQKDYPAAWASIMAALAVWGIRHAVAKVGTGEGPKLLPFLAAAVLLFGMPGNAVQAQTRAAPGVKCGCACAPGCLCWTEGGRCRCNGANGSNRANDGRGACAGAEIRPISIVYAQLPWRRLMEQGHGAHEQRIQSLEHGIRQQQAAPPAPQIIVIPTPPGVQQSLPIALSYIPRLLSSSALRQTPDASSFCCCSSWRCCG